MVSHWQITALYSMVSLKNSIFLASLFFLFPAIAEYTPDPQLSKQQNAFLESYAALKKGEVLDNTSLEDYILYPYLEYELIRHHTRLTPDKTLEKFIRRFDNSPMADKLWTVWLGRLVMRKQWQTVIDYYKKDTGGIAAKCYFLEAQIQYSLANNNPASNTLNVYLEKAKSLWLNARRLPSTCNSLFAILKQKGRINDEAYWQRIALVMAEGKTRLANNLAQHLNDSDKKRVKLWVKLRKDPEKYLADVLQKEATDNQADKNRQLIIYGLKRLARKKTDLAKNLWVKFQKKTRFTEKQKGEIQSYFGIRDALNHSPYALRRLASIPSENRTEKGNLWLARMSIRAGDWKKYLVAYQAMNEEQQKRDVWRYWRAHALDRNGDKASANTLFKALAGDASFYGFLSADHLNLDYQRLRQKPRNWSKCAPKIAGLTSIKRAVELFKIGKKNLAKQEWFWTLKHLNKEGVLAASAYAMEIKQPFLSIVSVSKTRDWNQVELRFPLQYKTLVESSARKHQIPPAWVYGIMRRESAFDAKIVSSAKAQGLMQVLPSTAKGVAKKLGILDHQKSDLLIPEKNANIGSAYLSGLLKRFKGNFVKATAAYNAGPNRVVKWAPDFNINAPRWVESIPFTETRKYVRAVMSYTTIYDYKLHHKLRANLRLSKRLKPVGPN